MYLPRSLISTLYQNLQQSYHGLSSRVQILVALEPDALCGCRILAQLFRRDFVQFDIHPIAGYSDLQKAGAKMIQPMMENNGGTGGIVVCLGVGGLVDLGALLGIEVDDNETSYGGVEVWVIDARRPWNLGNVFGGQPQIPAAEEGLEPTRQPGVDNGRIQRGYKRGMGGIIVFDDGDIEDDLDKERDAYLALVDMPEVDEDEEDIDGSDTESEDEGEESQPRPGQKRKSWSDRDDEDESEEDDDRPKQRRKSNMVCHAYGWECLC
jgi:cell division control protein 45